MTRQPEPQRFPDRHGWLHNRRAVVLDDDGITVERWVGRPLRIPWGDVTAVRWEGTGAMVLQAGDHALRFGQGMASLRGLGQAINAAMLARAEVDGRIRVEPADVERWLGGFRVAVVADAPPDDPPSSADVTLWAVLFGVVAAGCLLAWSASLPWNPWVLVSAPLAVGAALYVRVSAYLAERRGQATCRVLAGLSGVEVQRPGQLSVTFAWEQVERVNTGPRRHEVRLSGGRAVRLPASAALEPLIGALRMVVAHRAGYHAEMPPVPEAALSPAGPPAVPAGAVRGVSRVAPGAPAARRTARRGDGDGNAIPWATVVALCALLGYGVIAYLPLIGSLLFIVAVSVALLAAVDRVDRRVLPKSHAKPPNAMVLGGRVMLRDASGQEAVFGWDDVATVDETSTGYLVELTGGRVIAVKHDAGVASVVSALRMAVDGRSHFETVDAGDGLATPADQETLDA